MVCKLKKSLYGFKQAPRQWYKMLGSFMTSHKYKRTAANYCVYIRRFPDDKFFLLLLYVDGMLIAGTNVATISKMKEDLLKLFDVKD